MIQAVMVVDLHAITGHDATKRPTVMPGAQPPSLTKRSRQACLVAEWGSPSACHSDVSYLQAAELRRHVEDLCMPLQDQSQEFRRVSLVAKRPAVRTAWQFVHCSSWFKDSTILVAILTCSPEF